MHLVDLPIFSSASSSLYIYACFGLPVYRMDKTKFVASQLDPSHRGSGGKINYSQSNCNSNGFNGDIDVRTFAGSIKTNMIGSIDMQQSTWI